MNFIFDFDGTICDSVGEGIRIANKFLLENHKTPTTKEEVRKNGLLKLIRTKKIPTIKIAFYAARGRKEISKKIPDLKPYPGIKKALTILSKKHTIGILTSNSKENVMAFIEKNKMQDCFTFVNSELNVFGKDKALRKIINKYSLLPSETIYVGDEQRDIEAAKKVGIKSIAATWGLESQQILKKVTPDKLVSRPNMLLKFRLS